jgi:hypothetical protein
VTLSADRATAIRATFSRLVLLLRADDRHMHANDVVERITAAGFTVVVSELCIVVTSAVDGETGIGASALRGHTQWLLTLQACLTKILELESVTPVNTTHRTTEVSE